WAGRSHLQPLALRPRNNSVVVLLCRSITVRKLLRSQVVVIHRALRIVDLCKHSIERGFIAQRKAESKLQMAAALYRSDLCGLSIANNVRHMPCHKRVLLSLSCREGKQEGDNRCRCRQCLEQPKRLHKDSIPL